MTKPMRLAMLAPIAWRTPPRHYGPWEQVVSLITEGLVKQGIDVTLFATKDSVTAAKLRAVAPIGYEEDPTVHGKVWECLHISELFEHASEFDLIHNNFDFLPLSYTGLVKTPVVTTIHGFSSPKILPVFQKYNGRVKYVSISNADRDPSLDYIATVYHGIDMHSFTLNTQPDTYLIFFGRIHPDKGATEAIQIAKASGRKLIMAGLIQDQDYFKKDIEPHLDNDQVTYVGNVGPQERDKLLGQAAALLHPIHFNEPFGLSIVEAMACGTPVIAFNKGSMPEIIIDGQNGFLVQDVAEAIAVVDKISSLDRSKCREHVQAKFSQDRMVADYIKVYEQILK
jgi:glycosyltransferase involved in cell wall biosynthesis